MEPEVISLIAGFSGTVIGALVSIVTVIVQSRIQERRDRSRHITELAIEDYKFQLELAKGNPGRTEIPPLTLFVDYHLRLSKEIEKGCLSTEALERICNENEEMYEVLKRASTRSMSPKT